MAVVGGMSRVRGSEGKVGGVTLLTAVEIPAVGSVQSMAKRRRRSGNRVGGDSDAQIRPVRGTTTHTGPSHHKLQAGPVTVSLCGVNVT